MNTITNNEFKMLYTLIEKISSECSKRFKFKTITYLNMTEFNSLSFLFTIKYKGEMHTVERNLHRMEIMTANYEIYDSLMNYIDGVYKELRKKIEEDVNSEESKSLKSIKNAAKIIADLNTDLPKANITAKEQKDSIKNKTWGPEPKELWGKEEERKIDNLRNTVISNNPKISKELKDTTFITVCDACLTASCWNGDFMCQQSLHTGTVEKTVKELRKLNLENPDNWKKQFCGDFYES